MCPHPYPRPQVSVLFFADALLSVIPADNPCLDTLIVLLQLELAVVGIFQLLVPQ